MGGRPRRLAVGADTGSVSASVVGAGVDASGSEGAATGGGGMRALDDGFSAAGFWEGALRGEVLVVGAGTGVDDDCDSATPFFFPVRLVGAGVDSA